MTGRPSAASGSRRRDVDAAGRSSQFAAIRAQQVRAVGTAFLRARPIVIAPVAAINCALVIASGAPAAQRAALAGSIGLALALFIAERFWVTRVAMRERWLATSLGATVVLLAIGCALSGGVASPMLPLVLAPVVVAAAAFGRSWRTIATSVLAFLLIAGLALLPPGTPFPSIPNPWLRGICVSSFAGLLALAYAGVAGLVAAYTEAGELLERMRVATLEEAAGRMRATEQVGATLAHELKNPLAAIKALLQILRDRVDEKGTKRLEVALTEVDRMAVLVRDYLTFARPLAELDIAEVELRSVADDVVSVLADRAALSGVTLEARGDRVTIHGDARRLREALFNLTTNAIAATPRDGRVTLQITAAPDGARITVEDTGAGIAPELVDAPAFTTTHADGTGLGLPIARGAITQHGGTLHFAVVPEGGTIVTVTVPLRPGAAPANVAEET